MTSIAFLWKKKSINQSITTNYSSTFTKFNEPGSVIIHGNPREVVACSCNNWTTYACRILNFFQKKHKNTKTTKQNKKKIISFLLLDVWWHHRELCWYLLCQYKYAENKRKKLKSKQQQWIKTKQRNLHDWCDWFDSDVFLQTTSCQHLFLIGLSNEQTFNKIVCIIFSRFVYFLAQCWVKERNRRNRQERRFTNVLIW